MNERHLRRLVQQSRIGGAVLRQISFELLKISGICHHNGELLFKGEKFSDPTWYKRNRESREKAERKKRERREKGKRKEREKGEETW